MLGQSPGTGVVMKSLPSSTARRHQRPLPTNVDDFQPYTTPRFSLPHGDWILMDANECPFDPELSLEGAQHLNRCPDPTSEELRNVISPYYGVAPHQVLVTNGSDELIWLSVRTFARRGRAVVGLRPTYDMYRVSANLNGSPYSSVPVGADGRVDIDGLAALSAQADVLFLCNPNNPTGTVLAGPFVEAIVEAFDGLVVVDEAYGEFADALGIDSAARLVKGGVPNLLVLRTFSKAFAAAGARLGYGIGHPDVIAALGKAKIPYSVSRLSQAAGLWLWAHRSRMEANVRRISGEREKLMLGCRNVGCRAYPSVTNFFLIQMPGGVSAAQAWSRLRDEYHILLRLIDCPGQFPDTLRLSVGTPEQNETFLSAFTALLS
jgi:histidinol-phosphate aminotransferase